jgi:nucleoid DNA-binding protein
MNKKSLIRKVNDRCAFDRETGTMIFNRIFELVKKTLTDEKRFDIEGFGEFSVKHRKMKTMIDFKLKADVLLPPKDRLVFLPAYNLKHRINSGK